MADPISPIDQATERENPLDLAKVASADELTRLKLAEEVIQLRQTRRQRTRKLTAFSQIAVSVVALGGYAVNVYQARQAKAALAELSAKDYARWKSDFERSKLAEMYRALFYTSMLVADQSNDEKRLVGYALLQGFMKDKDYNAKAEVLNPHFLVSGDPARDWLGELSLGG